MTRALYLTVGFIFTAIGFAGVVLPLVPTVSPLLVALWCFARSSQRFHDWLWTHPRVGPPLQRWKAHGVIPVSAKLAACAGMSLSMTILLVTTSYAPWAYVAIGLTLAAIAAWIVSRPAAAPESA
jgi:uncharacterized membrane protein YbaN (DUF454 family)